MIAFDKISKNQSCYKIIFQLKMSQLKVIIIKLIELTVLLQLFQSNVLLFHRTGSQCSKPQAMRWYQY